MEVAGNAVGLDLGKRTYEMCLISKDNKISRTGGKTDFAGLDKLCMKLKKMMQLRWKPVTLLFGLKESLGKKLAAV